MKNMKFAATQLLIVAFALALGGQAHARSFGRTPASEITKSLKKKLAVKDHKKTSKYAKRGTKPLGTAEVDPTAQRDLTFESHKSYDSEVEGVSKRVGDRDFESLVN